MDEDKARLISDLRVLVDEKASAAETSCDVTDADTFEEAQFLLAEFFGAPDAPDAVNVMVGDTPVGVVRRDTLEQSERTAADSGAAAVEIGGGERIQLAGVSTQYKLLTFVCPACQREEYRVYYDERKLPACPDHGRMEYKYEA